MTASQGGPVAERQRIVLLDVLRGVAVCGIMFANIRLFAEPWSDLGLPPHDAPLHEHLAVWFVRIAIEYKFFSLFALLFGAGFMLQMQRAAAVGRSFVPGYLRRLGILAIIGLAHGMLLWFGDILFLYAICGILLLPLRHLSASRLTMIGIVLVLAGTSLGAARWLPASVAREAPNRRPELAAESSPDEPVQQEISALLRAAAGDVRSPHWRQAEHIAYREGPMTATVHMRTVQFQSMLVNAYGLGGAGLHALGMFLIGAAMLRAGWFHEASARILRCAAIATAFGGILLETTSTILQCMDAEFTSRLALAEAAHRLAAPLLAIALCGLFAFVQLTPLGRRPIPALAAVGRLALTNYLLQSVLAMSIMYWWGLGLFDQIGAAAQLAIGLAIVCAEVVASMLWLRWFAMGPLEWLWRAGTYGRWSKLRRRASI